jgi:hypothetical protein
MVPRPLIFSSPRYSAGFFAPAGPYRRRSHEHLKRGSVHENDRDAHCRDLSRQMSEAKLRFQTKSALTRRYEHECKTRNGPRERSTSQMGCSIALMAGLRDYQVNGLL